MTDGAATPDGAVTPDGAAPDTGPPEGCIELADGRCVLETFVNPPVLEPNGDGVYELEMVPTEFEFAGQRHCVRGYNGNYVAPTIETPARDGDAQRQVRVNYRNRFTKSDFVSVDGDDCECSSLTDGASCEPDGHGPGHDCHCIDDAGNDCHMFDFNLTNLHAHGSHVRPDYATGGGCVETDELKCRSCTADRDAEPRECFFADDVISQVAPGSKGAQHRWDIDEDGTHHEGLHWYHPHIHGSTAIQVASGATGTWLVRGPVDALPGIADARERIMVITTPPVGFEPLADGDPCDEDHITFNRFDILGDVGEGQQTVLNGVHRPRMLMPPGQIERWRWLHGAYLDEVTIALFRGLDSDCENLDFEAGPVPMTQIARDGLTMPRPANGADWPFAPPYIFMSPGYRIEAMLDGSQLEHGDTLCVMAGRFLQEDPDGRTDQAVGLLEPPTLDEILQLIGNGDVIGIVNVTDAAGEPTETELPDYAEVATHAPSLMLQGGAVDALARCEAAKAVEAVDDIDQVSALWVVPSNADNLDFCSCPDHNINCGNFELTDRERYPYDRVFRKGAVEHWRLMSGFDGHPFHIHINPFLVCPLPAAGSGHRNEKSRLFEPPFAHWRDTYLVNLDRTVDLLAEYRTHTGAFVFHCHKLTHEDHGMMELVNICDPEVEACDTLCDGVACDWRTCAPDDAACERERAVTECAFDPTKCPEAALRCTPCVGPMMACPPGSSCGDVPDLDDELRCVPNE